MALETNVALLNHDHAGITGGTSRLLQINTHQSADTDSATSALHHTLGSGATQAAQGTHTHTADSRLTTGVSARYYNGADQSIPNVSNVIVAYPSSVRTSSLVTQQTQGAGNAFRLNRAGIWTIQATVRFNPAGGGESYCAMQSNNAVITADGGPFAGITRTINISTTDYFNLNDVVTLAMYQSSGVTILTASSGGTWMNLNLTWLHD